MPKCFLLTIRGYRDRKYRGCTGKNNYKIIIDIFPNRSAFDCEIFSRRVSAISLCKSIQKSKYGFS